MEYLTLKILNGLENKPCHEALEAFEERFGTKAKIKEVIDWLNEIDREDWLAWILTETPEITKAFIENGADVHTYNDVAICWTAEDGQKEIAELLLKNGANVHAWDDSTLRYAVENGHTEMVELLLKNGANAHACDDEALRLAIAYDYKEIAELLEKYM